MTLEKMGIFDSLNEAEASATKYKIIATDMHYCEENAEEIVNYLKSKGIILTHPIEIRVCTIPLNQIQAKIRNLEDVNALDLAIQRPIVLTSNDSCLAICNRINTCIQDGIEYKDAKGNYYPFIWNKKEWDKKSADIINYARHDSSLNVDTIIEDFDKEHPDFNKEIDSKKVEENLKQADVIIGESNEKQISDILNNPEESLIETDDLANEKAFTFGPIDEDINPVDPNKEAINALDEIQAKREELEKAKKDLTENLREDVNNSLDAELSFLDIGEDVLGGRR